MTAPIQAHCYCGAVRLEIRTDGAPPLFTAYCHCDDCRRSHASPLYQVVCLDASDVTVTEGAEQVVPYRKSGSRLQRCFCGTCGTRVLNRFPDWTPRGRTPVAVFPSTFEAADQERLPEAFRPTRHNHAHSCRLDLDLLATLDGLSRDDP